MRKLFLTALGLFGLASFLNAQVFFEEDFDACSLPAGWTNEATDSSFVWLFVDASPDALNVGNLDGTCMALFDDDALGSGAANVGATLTSPIVDLSSATGTVLLEFDYNYRALGGSQFVVEVFNGASFDTVFNLTTISECGAWTCGPPYPKAQIDVSAAANPFFFLRFTYRDGGSWAWWAAFDNVSVRQLTDQDVATTEVISVPDDCGLTGNEPVSAIVTNVGGDTVTSVSMALTVDAVLVGTETWTVTLAPFASDTFNFSLTADLSGVGPHLIEVAANALPTDGDPANATDALTVTNLAPITSFPWITDFDDWATCSVATTCTTVCAAEDNWVNTGDDGQDWRTDAGGTASASTGPSADNTTGSGNYMYLETSSSCGTANLVSPCFDVTGMTNPTVQFFYHMYGANMGTLQLEISDDNGATWDSLWSQTGQVQTDELDPWAFEDIDISAYLGSVVKIRFVGIQAGTLTGDMAIDDIKVFDKPATDAELVSIDDLPLSDCELGAAVPISVTIRNNSLADISGFDVQYAINGGTPVVETVPDTIAPAATGAYTFAATADLSADGVYSIVATVLLTGDGDPSNDSAVDTVVNITPITTFPYVQDFDDWATCSNSSVCTTVCDAEQDWVNVSGDGQDWRTDADGTTSTNTGPSADHTQDSLAASQNYMYIETSNTTGCGAAYLESPCFDISGLAIPGVEFWYHMYGADIDTLALEVSDDNGATWTEIISFVGQQEQTDELDPWTKVTAPLTGFAGVIKIRFKGTEKPGTGFVGDMAIDDVSILDLPPAGDLEVVEVLTPSGSACELSNTEVISAVIRNAGAVNLSGFNYGYKVNAGASVVQNYGPSVLPPLGVDTVTFGTPANLSADGVYTISVVGALVGDSDNNNDTARIVVENKTAISSFPYLETFDEWATCSTSSTCGTVCDAENGWVNNSDDVGDWRTDAGGTPSTTTGPSQDHTQDTAAASQNYLYIEGSASSCFGPTILTSPCFDISGMTLPGVQFWYHMYGSTMGTLALEVSDDNGATWTEVYSRTGQDQTASADPWKQVTVGLSGFAGTVQIRFVYNFSATFNADCAIDDIAVLDLPAFEDMLVSSVEPSGAGCAFGSAEAVTIGLQSLGSVASTGFDVAYSINGGTPVVENVGALSVAPGFDTTYTFSATADFSADGSYDLQAWVIAAGDVNNANDTAAATVVNETAVSTLPFTEDFESYTDGTSTFAQWANTTSSLELWEAEAGNTSSTGTGPIGPNSGTLYAYIESSGAIAGDIATLTSPCVDLSAAVNPRLNFFYHMWGPAIGGLYVTVDNDVTVDTVLALIGEQDTAEADPWNQALVDLSAYIGQTVRVNIIGQVADPIPTGASSFEADIAIDDIVIEDPVNNDVGVVSILAPSTGCGLTATETVSVAVQNFGLLTASSVQMRYRVNGGPFTTESWTTSIAPGGVDTFTFAGTANLSVAGDYTILASASTLGDGNLANDTLSTTVTSEAGGVTLPYIEDFEAYGEFVTSFDAWSNTTSALETWETEAGNTPTASTGPDDAAQGTIYAYIEASGAIAGDIATLTSPCLDLAGTTNPRLFFNYHMYGADIGGLFVTVESNGGATVDTILSLIGQQDTANSFTDPWNGVSLPLTAYIGQRITVNIIGRVDGTGGLADMAIDNIVLDDPVAADAGVVGLVGPADGCGLGLDTISVLVRNFGLNPVTSVQMRFQVNGGTLVTENWTTSLDPFEVDTFTFSTLGNFSTGGPNTLLASASALGDGNLSNNSQTFTVNNGAAVGYFIDFDDLAEAVTDFGTILVNLGPDIDWETEAGPTPSTTSGTGPSDDASGGGNYIYMETSSPVDTGDKATLQIECATIPADGAQLVYAYHMFGAATGQLEIAALTATDTTDLRVWVGQQQFATTDPWARDTIDLSAYAGQTIAIRFTGVASDEPGGTISFTGDIALDEIGIIATPAPACNSAITPGNQAHVNLANRVELTWDPQPAAVACQVQGKRLPTGPQPSVNILSAPINTTNVPYAVAGAGTTWTWRVRCACNISPLDVSAFSAYGDTFSIPLAKEGQLLELDLDLFPNPADRFVNVTVRADEAAERDVVITDLVGRVFEGRRVNLVEGVNTIQFNVEGYAEGMYFLRVGDASAVPFEVLR